MDDHFVYHSRGKQEMVKYATLNPQDTLHRHKLHKRQDNRNDNYLKQNQNLLDINATLAVTVCSQVTSDLLL